MLYGWKLTGRLGDVLTADAGPCSGAGIAGAVWIPPPPTRFCNGASFPLLPSGSVPNDAASYNKVSLSVLVLKSHPMISSTLSSKGAAPFQPEDNATGLRTPKADSARAGSVQPRSTPGCGVDATSSNARAGASVMSSPPPLASGWAVAGRSGVVCTVPHSGDLVEVRTRFRGGSTCTSPLDRDEVGPLHASRWCFLSTS
jgi:hypothetical protein